MQPQNSSSRKSSGDSTAGENSEKPKSSKSTASYKSKMESHVQKRKSAATRGKANRKCQSAGSAAQQASQLTSHTARPNWSVAPLAAQRSIKVLWLAAERLGGTANAERVRRN